MVGAALPVHGKFLGTCCSKIRLQSDLCQTQPEEYSDFRYYLATGFATWESLIGDQWTCGGGTMVYDPAMGICYGQGSTRLAKTAWNFSFF